MKSKTNKGKASGKQPGKKPIVNAGQRREVHVPECMVWPDPSAPQPPPGGYTQTERVRPAKSELGRPLDRGYTFPKENDNPNAECELERDSVLQAIRGWPHNQHCDEQPTYNEFDDFMNGYGVSGGSLGDPYTDYAKTDTAPKKETKKKKGSKSSKNERDAHIADLVAHRYMYQAAMERQKKEEEKRRAEDEANRAMRSRKFPKDIKANKTSQLRSIAMAEKVERSASDLWQMPKFKNNAKPALDTKRKGGKSGKTGNKNGASRTGTGNGEAFPTCTCEEEQTGYHGATQDRYTQRTPEDYRGQVAISPDLDNDQSDSGNIVAL